MKQFLLFLVFFSPAVLISSSELSPTQLRLDKLEALITQVEFSTRMIKKRSDLSQEAINSLSAQKSTSVAELKNLLDDFKDHLSKARAGDEPGQEGVQRDEPLARMFDLLAQIEGSEDLEICNEFMILVDMLKRDLLGYNRHMCCDDPNHDHNNSGRLPATQPWIVNPKK